MNNEIENELDELDEENENYITLTDDNGEDVSFEILDTVEYKERLFAVLLPFESEEDEVVILEILPAEDPEYDDFVSVEDENLLNEVFEEFKKAHADEFDFQ
ncbi:MAG: DUF1292 domain-containing protein [Ruminococcus flavefaciens]|nr:DUF1292 domain-containing protein [Ruminococcus flavefaciens]MCM1058937.1 DUF1292 domain-containing protein [Eubacterium sp.]MCM1269504.1 DUF1292 domain-containing protein [Ruminococcus flavefaciens]MCM1360757.1 DUF1292 domain-containing protein [Clostridiales bacterium]MCM1434909.1 DUF1292 domain-containing protein [Ruminococcus flavefaciens]